MKNHRTMGPVADNTEATINHLNANQDRVHMPEFKGYVKANYELATDLEDVRWPL